MVLMRHDGIDRPIEVPEVSVRVYERSGWRVVDDGQGAAGEQGAEAKGRRRIRKDNG